LLTSPVIRVDKDGGKVRVPLPDSLPYSVSESLPQTQVVRVPARPVEEPDLVPEPDPISAPVTVECGSGEQVDGATEDCGGGGGRGPGPVGAEGGGEEEEIHVPDPGGWAAGRRH
jgi:hypothetical protein